MKQYQTLFSILLLCVFFSIVIDFRFALDFKKFAIEQ